MKVFVTWSGKRSRSFALFLRTWLRDVLHQLEPWVSDRDIPAGVMWSPEIIANLQAASAGIICVTPENQTEPWVMFEAGALANHFGTGPKVLVYLIGMSKADLVQGPLTLYQASAAEKADTLKLIHSLNSCLGDLQVPADVVERSFERCWPELERQIRVTESETPTASRSRKPPEELLEEVLIEIRRLARQNATGFMFTAGAARAHSTPEDREAANRYLERAHRTQESIERDAAIRLRSAIAARSPYLLPYFDRSKLICGREGLYELATHNSVDYHELMDARHVLDELMRETELGFGLHIIRLNE